ncbi:ABC transporter permease subunit [Salipiger sp. P9]|uniref:amino acid ABC transporter permease n=1 Tax=Salipiger pentaromativorans TaxID=2943193 RepID=UPI0021586FEF|nr:ABC transporter permease subunit [Salipiger pentaromativorans]MCR8547526.1 ABC transporter permease subunit [Salipiger pentaromativorans]
MLRTLANDHRAIPARAEPEQRLPPRPPSLWGAALWRTRRGRQFIVQVVGSCLLFAFLIEITHILQVNLARQNLELDFGFLNRPAGIAISETVLPYSPEDGLSWLIVTGAANSLRVALVGCLLATFLGLVVGILRVSDNPLLRVLTGGYVNVVRNTPLLLQILFWYTILLQLPPVRQAISLGDVVFLSQRGLQIPKLLFEGGGWALLAAGAGAVLVYAVLPRAARALNRAVPGRMLRLCAAVLGFGLVLLAVAPMAVELPEHGAFNFKGGMTLTPEYTALTLAQSLYAGAFIAELVRGGIEGVARGQREAGASLGLSELQILRKIVIPQALVAITPSVSTQYIGVIKNTSLAVAIGYPDFFWALTITINISGHSIEGVGLMLLGYLIPTLIAAMLMNRFNRGLLKKGRS